MRNTLLFLWKWWAFFIIQTRLLLLLRTYVLLHLTKKLRLYVFTPFCLSFREFMKILPKTFIYESILIKIYVNADIMNTQIFHLIKYDLNDNWRSQNVTFMFILTLTYVLMDNFLSLFVLCFSNWKTSIVDQVYESKYTLLHLICMSSICMYSYKLSVKKGKIDLIYSYILLLPWIKCTTLWTAPFLFISPYSLVGREKKRKG